PVEDGAHHHPVVLGAAHLHLREGGEGQRPVPLLFGDPPLDELLLHALPHHRDDVFGGRVLVDVVAAGPEVALQGAGRVLGDAVGGVVLRRGLEVLDGDVRLCGEQLPDLGEPLPLGDDHAVAGEVVRIQERVERIGRGHLELEPVDAGLDARGVRGAAEDRHERPVVLMTPWSTSVVAMSVPVSPSATCTSTSPWPGPSKSGASCSTLTFEVTQRYPWTAPRPMPTSTSRT